jgi:hypothetical protein
MIAAIGTPWQRRSGTHDPGASHLVITVRQTP